MGWSLCPRSDTCRSVRGFPTLLSTMMLGVARHPFRIDGARVYDEGAVRLWWLFFSFPLSFLSHSLNIHVNPSKNWLCLLVSISINFDHYSFYYYLFYFECFLKFFFSILFLGILFHLIFFIQSVPDSFDWYFLCFILFLIIFLNFISYHFISFNFLFNFGPHSFDCYFLIFFLICFFNFVSQYFILFNFFIQFWSLSFDCYFFINLFCFFNLIPNYYFFI